MNYGTIWFPNHMVLYMNEHQLDRAFGALADSTRRAILNRLLQGEASVAELASPFAMTPRAISKHISVLENAGLVQRSRDAQRRPSRIQIDPLIGIDKWLDRYRGLWNARFDKLEARLAKKRRDR
jgi:DNA-binding transcriptional ArsR family regulator